MSDGDYKVVGELDSEHGAGVYGHNRAEGGNAVGVKGKTDSGEGYGLYTPDHARVEGELDATAVRTTAEAGDAPATRLQPGADALREGFVVATGPAHQVVVDPRNYESDAAAIQAANDTLATRLTDESAENGVGFLYIPALKADGDSYTEWQIDETIVCGSRTERVGILPRGWGFTGGDGPLIQCTIDSGDPLFLVSAGHENTGVVNCQSSWFGGLAADASGNDGTGNDVSFLALKNVNAFRLKNNLAQNFNPSTADGVYVFDGACWNSYINHCNFTAPFAECPDADVYVLKNTTPDRDDWDLGPPGELKFGPGNSTYAKYAFNTGLRIETGSRGIAWGGRLEGAGGEALVYADSSNAEDGSVYLTLTSTAEIGRVEDKDGTGTDHIYFDGASLFVSPAIVKWHNNTTGGHGVHVAGVRRGYIPPIHAEGHFDPGDAVHVEEDPAGDPNTLVVPRESTCSHSVTYPGDDSDNPTWNGLVYPDGWKKYRTGTATVSTGSAQRVESYAGRVQSEVTADVWLSELPDIEVAWDWYWGYDGTSDRSQVALIVEEKTGNGGSDASITVGYAIYRLGSQQNAR